MALCIGCRILLGTPCAFDEMQQAENEPMLLTTALPPAKDARKAELPGK